MGPHHHSPVDRDTVDIGAVDGFDPARFPEACFGSGGLFRICSFMDCELEVGKKCPRSGLGPKADELTEATMLASSCRPPVPANAV